MNDLISINLLTYNSEKYISSTLKSIYEQTYKNIEFIIVDDGSTDKTIEIVQKFISSKKISPFSTKFFKNKHKGVAASRNLAIRNSTGKYVAIMDADDIAMNNRINEEINFLITSKSDFVSCNAIIIDFNDDVICKRFQPNTKTIIEKLISSEDNFILNPGILAKKTMLDNLGGFNENYGYGTDGDLWRRAISNGYIFNSLQKSLIQYRLNDNSISFKTFGRNNINIYTCLIMLKNYDCTNFFKYFKKIPTSFFKIIILILFFLGPLRKYVYAVYKIFKNKIYLRR